MFNLVESENEEENNVIEFRHYGVSARQRAVNRGIKKLINNTKVPNLAKYNDIADFILRNASKSGTGGDSLGAYSSESEVDDLPGSKITLPDDYLDKKKDSKVAIRLHELGPRLKMKLIKIEEGLCRGNVVFHALKRKSPAEVRKQLDSLKNKRELKEKRKRIQEENVKRKQEKLGKPDGDGYEWEKDDKEVRFADPGEAEANIDEGQEEAQDQGKLALGKRKFGQ